MVQGVDPWLADVQQGWWYPFDAALGPDPLAASLAKIGWRLARHSGVTLARSSLIPSASCGPSVTLRSISRRATVSSSLGSGPSGSSNWSSSAAALRNASGVCTAATAARSVSASARVRSSTTDGIFFMVWVMIRTCSPVSSPRARAAAVPGYTGSSGSPVTDSGADCTSNSSATEASSNATVDSLSTVASRSTTPSMTRTLVRTTDRTGSYPQSRIHPQIHPCNGFGSGKRVDSACDNEV